MNFKRLLCKSSKTLKNYILIITCIFLIVLLVYTNIIVSVKRAHQDISYNFKEAQFESIMLYYDELKVTAFHNAINVATNIESDIRENINLNSLKEDMDDGTIPQELYDILENNCKGVSLNNIENGRNGIVVMSNGEILIDYNYGRTKLSAGIEQRTIETDRKRTWNKSLFDDAITKIINKTNSDDMIAIEMFENTNVENHTQIKIANYSNFRKIYMEEGIHGFIRYSFFVPAYITEHGDIFGQKDIDKGIMQENHKFIILQEFNLFDQIQKYHLEFLLNDDEAAVLAEHEVAVNALYILGMVLIASYIIVVIVLSNVHNTVIKREHENNDY